MKKKNTILICIMVLLLLGIIILPIGFPKGAMNNGYSKSEWTREIAVKDGVVTPKKLTSDFTIDKDGSYRLGYGWMPEGTNRNKLADINISDVHFETVYQIFDSNGDQVFSTCAGYIFADTVIELKAGQYSAEYTFFTERDSFIEFAKENICAARDAAGLADDVGFGSYGGDAAIEMHYYMSRQTAGSDPFVSIWVFLIILFLLVLMIFLSGLNKKEDYDERQRLERGKAYGLGFFTIMGSIFLAIAIDLLELLPVQGYVLCAASIFPGLMVFLAYSIWHEAYFSLKDKTGALLGMFGIIGAVNLIIAVASICDGSMIVNGRLGLKTLNAVCAVMFIEVFVVVLMKKISTAKETYEEDED